MHLQQSALPEEQGISGILAAAINGGLRQSQFTFQVNSVRMTKLFDPAFQVHAAWLMRFWQGYLLAPERAHVLAKRGQTWVECSHRQQPLHPSRGQAGLQD